MAAHQRRHLRLQRGATRSTSACATPARSTTRTSRSIVVDDGSTDDDRRDRRALTPASGCVQIPHGGLSVARNEGFQRRARRARRLPRRRRLSDSRVAVLPGARPSTRRDVGGAGGPNLPPPDDPHGAHVVARSPGGPVHVLISDDRAEHVPGCNMAFWKIVLAEVGGFDPVYTAAGDDVDLCWKVLDARLEDRLSSRRRRLAPPPPGPARLPAPADAATGAARPWSRPATPSASPPLGTARWRGRIYNSLTPSLAPPADLPRAVYGTAAYQSVYRGGGHLLDLVHQVGVPVAALLVADGAAGVAVARGLRLPAAGRSCGFLVALAGIDMARARAPASAAAREAAVPSAGRRSPPAPATGPVAGRAAATDMRPAAVSTQRPPCPARCSASRAGWSSSPRIARAQSSRPALISVLRCRGIRTSIPSGWEDYDARLLLSPLALR